MRNAPVVRLRVGESPADVLLTEVFADNAHEVWRRDDQLENGVDTARRLEDMVLAAPRLGPDVLGHLDHGQDDLGPPLRGQSADRACPADDPPDGGVQALAVDADRAVAPLVDARLLLLKQDLALKRAAGVAVEAHDDLVSLTIQRARPCVQLVFDRHGHARIDRLAFGLHGKDAEALLVGQAHRHRQVEGKVRPLCLMQNTESHNAVLAVVDRHEALAGIVRERAGGLVVRPRTLEVAEDGIQPEVLRLQHRLADVKGVVVVILAVDTLDVLAEPLDLAHSDDLLRRKAETVDVYTMLLEPYYWTDLKHQFLRGRCGPFLVVVIKGSGQC